MLPRAQRLNREQFSDLRRHSYKHASNEALSARWYPAPGSSNFRVGIVISAKAIPSSVRRHEIKRRLYATFLKKSQPRGTLVLYPTKKILELRGETLKRAVQEVMSTLGLGRI